MFDCLMEYVTVLSNDTFKLELSGFDTIQYHIDCIDKLSLTSMGSCLINETEYTEQFEPLFNELEPDFKLIPIL